MDNLFSIFAFCLVTIIGFVSCTEIVQEQVVVVDAGSSGSRIKIYTTNKTSSEHALPQYLLSPDSFKFGALSKLSSNPLKVVTQFCDVIQREATRMVKNPSNTKLLIMATAGMRGLDEDLVASTLSIIKNYFNDPTKTDFLFGEKNCRILSGEEEAAFAWIAINYINKSFQDPAIERVGIIELGGASMQVAFESKNSILAHLFPVKIAGHWYRLYANSYYGLGLTFLENSASNLLTSDSNPCDLRDNKIKTDSEFSSCKDLVMQSLKLKYDVCILKPCSIRYTYQPSIDRDSPAFYAMGAFRGIMKAIRISVSQAQLNTLSPTTLQNGDISVSQLRKLTKIYCEKDLEVVIEKGVSTKYASSNCMGGVYFVNVLDALGFEDDNIIQGFLPPESKQNNLAKPDWTLGAVIYEHHRHNNYYSERVRGVKNSASRLSNVLLYVILPTFIITAS